MYYKNLFLYNDAKEHPFAQIKHNDIILLDDFGCETGIITYAHLAEYSGEEITRENFEKEIDCNLFKLREQIIDFLKVDMTKYVVKRTIGEILGIDYQLLNHLRNESPYIFKERSMLLKLRDVMIAINDYKDALNAISIAEYPVRNIKIENTIEK